LNDPFEALANERLVVVLPGALAFIEYDEAVMPPSGPRGTPALAMEAATRGTAAAMIHAGRARR
jgi:hypothetical protein